MSSKLPYLAAAVTTLVVLAGPALAAGCTTSAPTLLPVTLAPVGTFYLATTCDPAACTAGVWLYEESNQKGGLQRDDTGRDDTMDGACYPADRRLF